MLDLVEAAVNSGHLEDARAHVAEAVRLNLAQVSPRVEALILAITAMTAPEAEAEDLYQAALGHPGIVDFPFDYTRIVLAHGMWLRRMRRYTEARAALESAAAGFDRLGARPWADRTRAELRASGGTSIKYAPGEAVALSAQEYRVAELAAAGRTSREIAVQLSLSPRTVDSHLARAFRKLGVTRRAGLGNALSQVEEPEL